MTSSSRVYWVVAIIALVITFGLGILLVFIPVFFFDGLQLALILPDIAKVGLELVVIGVLGGAATYLLKQLDEIRRERNQIDEYRLGIMREVIASYNKIKSARRILRAYGFNSLQATTLMPVQITEFVSQMRILNEAQLSLERIKLEIKAQPNIFQGSTEILNCLDTVEKYIGRVVRDWENHGEFVWSGASNERFSPLQLQNSERFSPLQLQNLDQFLARARVSFRERAARPLDTLVERISGELLRGRRMDKRLSGILVKKIKQIGRLLAPIIKGNTLDALETRMTQKGQVTIPTAIRHRLGLKPKDVVRFEVEGDAVKLKPATSQLLAGFGAVTPREKPEDWRKVRAEVEEAMADEVAAEDR